MPPSGRAMRDPRWRGRVQIGWTGPHVKWPWTQRQEGMDRMDINKLLDTARQTCGATSDSALALRLGVTKQAVSNWRQAVNLPDVVACEKLANMAGFKPLDVIAAIYEQREISRDAKAVWKRIASVAALSLVALTGMCSGWNLGATAAPSSNAYYVNLRRWLNKVRETVRFGRWRSRSTNGTTRAGQSSHRSINRTDEIHTGISRSCSAGALAWRF